MSAYCSNSDLPAVAARLRAAKHLTIVSHAKPDGDAAGSVLALARALRSSGKRVDAFFSGVVDPNILALAQPGEVLLAPQTMPSAQSDLVVIVDTGAWSQLEPLQEYLRSMVGRIVGLDHHARGDAIADQRVVDCSMASATQLVVQLIDLLGVPLVVAGSPCKYSIAEALFVGLATDTGWFRFASADGRVFALASRLLECGVDKIALYQLLEENGRPVRLAAMARALSSLSYFLEGRIALMTVSFDDCQNSGAKSEDVGGLVNVPLTIGSIKMSVVLTEAEAGVTKASFRSKNNSEGVAEFDVNSFAARFGGGGHVLAAGAKFNMPLAEARAKLEHEFESLGAVTR
ncbi:MAG: bifunctional oligoribonuclease/PAP phosphatase NrnA [Phycisphaerales bacterium]|nr:bifunctional oligoribonuclease/PAP phosphatase NrnA [Phycisphaerales bacterium]